MRRNRNEAIYDIGVISFKEAKESIDIAKELIDEVVKHIIKKNPQQKLF